MKVYIVQAFDAEPYSNSVWVDSVFSSLKAAQDYVNSHHNEYGRPKKLGSPEDGEYFLSSYITTKTLRN